MGMNMEVEKGLGRWGFDCGQQAIQENQRKVLKKKNIKRWIEEKVPLGRNHQVAT